MKTSNKDFLREIIKEIVRDGEQRGYGRAKVGLAGLSRRQQGFKFTLGYSIIKSYC